jgi:hypothetical protein
MISSYSTRDDSYRLFNLKAHKKKYTPGVQYNISPVVIHSDQSNGLRGSTVWTNILCSQAPHGISLEKESEGTNDEERDRIHVVMYEGSLNFKSTKVTLSGLPFALAATDPPFPRQSTVYGV